jgi:hydrogenase-1 operon protein HyaF
VVTFSAAPPDGLMNGPAVLAEIEQQLAAYRAGGEAHTVNLSRLPITPGDRAFLAERLGEGDLKIRVRGYGETRITAAQFPNVWWVHHYNASEQLLVDSIEVSDFPTVARATPEDLADSAVRLSELLGET